VGFASFAIANRKNIVGTKTSSLRSLSLLKIPPRVVRIV